MRLKALAGWRAPVAAVGILFGMLVVPAQAQGPELAMLDGLRSGAWDIHIRSDDSTSRICLRTGRELIQIRHRQQSCTRYVVDDKPNEVTVHYACAGNGYGQTTIRRENSQLVQISSQGIEGRAPFNFSAEGRYAGAC